jgi:phosphate/sulfate permease
MGSLTTAVGMLAVFGSFFVTAIVAGVIAALLMRSMKKRGLPPVLPANEDVDDFVDPAPAPRNRFKMMKSSKKEKRRAQPVTGPASVIDIDSFQEQ